MGFNKSRKIFYYVDTSIYLNLWQKEVHSKTGKPFWKITKDFLQKAEDSNITIYYSGFVLRELYYILGDDFKEKVEIFLDKTKFRKVFALPHDYEFARKIEIDSNYEIGFFDCLHIVLSRKYGSILITRDNKLIEHARRYCKVGRPEDFL